MVLSALIYFGHLKWATVLVKNYKYGHYSTCPIRTIFTLLKIVKKKSNNWVKLNGVTPQRNFSIVKFHVSTSILITPEAMRRRHEHHVPQILRHHPFFLFFFTLRRRRCHPLRHRIIILPRAKRLCGLRRSLLNVPGLRRRRHREPRRGVGEVEAGWPSPQRDRRHVMRTRRHLRRGKGPEPNPGLLVGLAHLAHPLAGVPPSHAAVHRVARLPELLPPGAFLGIACRQKKILVRQRRSGASSRPRRGGIWVGEMIDGKHVTWWKASFFEVVWVNETTCAKGVVSSN